METIKKVKTRPELLRLLKKSANDYKKMSKSEKEELHRKQAESWARQDLD